MIVVDTTTDSIQNITTKTSINSEMTIMIREDLFTQMKSMYDKEAPKATGNLITDRLHLEILTAKELIVDNVIKTTPKFNCIYNNDLNPKLIL